MSKTSKPFLSAQAHHPADPFRLLVESVVDYAIYMVDPARLIASWNPGAERIYGYRADEIIGQPFSTVFSPSDLVNCRPDEIWKFSFAAGHHESERIRARKDGSEFWAVVTVSALKDHFGNHAGFSVVTRDITERKRAEEAVRRERDLSNAILSSLPGIYYIYDENRRFLRWNSRIESVTGYSAEEIGGLHPLDLFDPADRQRVAERIEAVFQNGRCEVEADLLTKDGRRIPYYFNGVRTAIEGRSCLLGMGMDITSQMEARDELHRTSSLLRAVIEGTPDALYVKDRSGKYLLYNPAAARFVSKSVEEVVGRDDHALFGAEGARAVMENDQRVLASNRPHTLEEQLTAAGVTRTYLSTKLPLQDSDGNVVGVLGLSRDITDRKRMEMALLTRNNLYAMLSRTNSAVNRCVTPQQLYQELCEIAVEVGRFQFAWVGVVDANRVRCVASAGTDHGYMDTLIVTLDEHDLRSHGPTGRAAITGKSYVVNDFLTSPMTKPWHESANRVGFAASAAFPLIERGGVVSILTLYAGRIGFFTEELLTTLSEITPSVSFALDGFVQERERKQAEEKLLRNRALLRVASRIGRMGAWAVELEGLHVIWSEDLLAMLELPLDHSPDFEYGIDIYLPEYRTLVRDAFTECVRNGTPFDLEVQCRTAGGRCLWIRILGEVVRDRAGVVTGAQGAFQDISDRRQSAEVLQLRDRAIQAVSQGILISDPNQEDNPVIYASEGFTRMTGYPPDEVIGRNCRFLQGSGTDADTVRELHEAIVGARSCSVEILNYRKDGKPFWNQLTITPILGPAGELTHFVGVQTDVTERRRLEEQFRQAQKMEAVGQLAGGVAHDFNNLLTIINGYSELLLAQFEPDDPMREMLLEVHRAGERANALTRQLLAFSRQQVLEPRVVQLNDIVRDSEKMLRRLVGENILLATSFEPNLGRVKADPGQIEQVLMNLVVNARDAIPKSGNITVETQNVLLDESYCRGFADLAPGNYVLLAVSDTGVGMDDATRARIFEPFFTTKELGKGTGLGLATVHGIVKQSRGHIAVYSEPGRGTTFKVYLPQIADATHLAFADVASQAMPRGNETVLLVEDEEAVRAMATRLLRDCGYKVITAANGKDAINLAGAESGPIHLMVSDVVMPHLGGAELAARMVAIHPNCRVLFMSGYTDDAVIRHGILEGEYAFLQKPFAPSALVQKVRLVLDNPPQGGRARVALATPLGSG